MYMPYLRYSLLLLCSLYLAACASIASQDATTVRKAATDHRSYEGFVLPNGMKVIVISDPDTHQAAAAVDVKVGSGHDPVERQGLAHFLEHMLFLGTQKYPEASSYQSYISAHGGNHNAYTSHDNTNYFFDVDEDKLEPALDRLAQFFIAPKFDQAYLDREKNAVHSEFHLSLKDDNRRSLDVIKSIINPAHPFSKFSTGNLQTLSERGGQKLRDEVIAFYQKHYYAKNMSLVVLGKESLPELKNMVIEKFSAVPADPIKPLGDNDNITASTSSSLFVKGALPQKLLINSEKDIDSMSIIFPVPDDSKYYKTNPFYYLAHFLGHEGKGSLLSELKRLGWAEGLRSGGGVSFENGALYTIDISLTKKGLDHVDDITSLFFQTVRAVEKSAITQEMYDEQTKISRLWFEFKEPARPIDAVSTIATNLQKYPLQDVLSGPFMMEEYKPDLIKEMLAYINPDNVLISVLSNSFESSLKSSWYQTPYKIKSVSKDTLKTWKTAPISKNIFMPAMNPYLVDNYALVEHKSLSETPELILAEPNLKVWHLDANLSKLPKANIYARFLNDYASTSIKQVLLNHLYADVINDAINEDTYDAYLTGLNIYFTSAVKGINLKITGFSDKQFVLFDKVKTTVQNLNISDARFASLKAELKKALENRRLDKPYLRAYARLNETLQQPSYPLSALIDSLDQITLSDLKTFNQNFWKGARAEVLVNGNFNQAQVKTFAKDLKQLLPQTATTQAKIGWVKVPKGAPQYLHAHSKQSDSAYLRYVQGESNSLQERAYFLMTSQILRPLFYHQLRTQQQLGYLVNAGYSNNFGVPGLAFLVQSNHAPSPLLDKAVEAFMLNMYTQVIDKISEEEFENNRRSVRALVIAPPESLREQTDIYWGNITLNEPFTQRYDLLGEINKLSFEKWKAFFKERFAPEAQRRELRILTKRNPLTDQEILKLQNWRNQQDVYWVE